MMFLLGCSRKVGISDVLGTYAANRGQTVDTLEIKKDGSYFYTCKLASTPDFGNTAHWSNASPDTSDFTNEDHWKLHIDDGKPRITLDHFRACARDYRRPPGFWDLPVERSWRGTIQLPIDSDVNYYWVKQNL
jgi:hypothetical protein